MTAISGQFRIWPDFSFQKKRQSAFFLGGDRSILLSYGTMFSKALFFQASEDSVMFIVSFGVVLLIRKVDY